MQSTVEEAFNAVGFPSWVLSITDLAARGTRFLNRKSWKPYEQERQALRAQIVACRGGNERGVDTLMMPIEFGCITDAQSHNDGSVTMRRGFDLAPEYGHLPIVAIQEGDAGIYANITYCGFLGIHTAMKPKSENTEGYSIAMHYAPIKKRLGAISDRKTGQKIDVVLSKLGNLLTRGVSPGLILEQGMRQDRTAEDFIERLKATPNTAPYICHVEGGGNYWIVEVFNQKSGEIAVHSMEDNPMLCGTNSWLTDQFEGAFHSRPCWPYIVRPGPDGTTAEARLARLQEEKQGNPAIEFEDVLTRLNPDYGRLACIMNSAHGTLKLVGTDGQKPATQPLELNLNEMSLGL
jgi:hypothetical protein